MCSIVRKVNTFVIFDTHVTQHVTIKVVPSHLRTVEEVYNSFLPRQIRQFKICGWEAGRPRLGAGALGFSETSATNLGPSVNEAACVSPGFSR